MKDSTTIKAVSCLGLLWIALLAWTTRDFITGGGNDFLPLYAGACLVGSEELYDHDRLLEVETERAGLSHPGLGYIRPPFVAVFMEPLCALPYAAAGWVWRFAAAVALAGFVALWIPGRRHYAFLALTMSVPAAIAWVAAQDVPFLLLTITAAMRLGRADKPFAAGLVFSLCASKGHLFLLTPIWALARREWGFLKGLLLGGALLAAISFAVEGPAWPLENWREATQSLFSPKSAWMPNLRGSTEGWPLAWAWKLAFGLVAAGAVWLVARKGDFESALSAGSIGGLLIGEHAYMYDLTLIIPALLTLIAVSRRQANRMAAIGMLTPAFGLLVVLSPATASLAAFALLALLCSWAAGPSTA